MALLSEATIKDYMDRKLLVLGGDREEAVGAAYRFHPHVVIPGGGHKKI